MRENLWRHPQQQGALVGVHKFTSRDLNVWEPELLVLPFFMLAFDVLGFAGGPPQHRPYAFLGQGLNAEACALF